MTIRAIPQRVNRPHRRITALLVATALIMPLASVVLAAGAATASAETRVAAYRDPRLPVDQRVRTCSAG